MVNNNNQTSGWKQYFSLFLLVALAGYLISNGANIAGFYGNILASTVIGCVGAAIVTVHSIYANKRVLAKQGEALEQGITHETNRLNMVLDEEKKTFGSFGRLNKLANANIAVNAVSTAAVLARLLPPMQPNDPGNFSEAQKAGLVAITALGTAALLFNFTYSTVVSGRNTALAMRLNDLKSQPVPPAQAVAPVLAPQ